MADNKTQALARIDAALDAYEAWAHSPKGGTNANKDNMALALYEARALIIQDAARIELLSRQTTINGKPIVFATEGIDGGAS